MIALTAQPTTNREKHHREIEIPAGGSRVTAVVGSEVLRRKKPPGIEADGIADDGGLSLPINPSAREKAMIEADPGGAT